MTVLGLTTDPDGSDIFAQNLHNNKHPRKNLFVFVVFVAFLWDLVYNKITCTIKVTMRKGVKT